MANDTYSEFQIARDKLRTESEVEYDEWKTRRAIEIHEQENRQLQEDYRDYLESLDLS